MKILITGGNGFIGMNVAEFLLQRGYNVVLLSNTSINKKMEMELSRLPGSYYFVQDDITSGSENLYKILNEYEITSIIHAATITPDINDEKKSSINIMDVNIMGTLYLLEAAVKANINRFIYLSSATVYGNSSYNHSVLKEEDADPLPENFYSISKLTGERMVLRYQQLHKISSTIIRVGAAYGPWEHESGVRSTISPIYMITKLAMQGENIILPRNSYKDWIYSRDIAKGIFKILTTSSLNHYIYNLGGNSAWTLQDWCLKLKETIPDFNFEIGVASEPNILLHENKDRGILSNERIVKDLNFNTFYSLDDSFYDYINWLKKVIL